MKSNTTLDQLKQYYRYGVLKTDKDGKKYLTVLDSDYCDGSEVYPEDKELWNYAINNLVMLIPDSTKFSDASHADLLLPFVGTDKFGIRERVFHIDGENIEIWRFGIDDYCANFMNADCSVRGTLLDVLRDIDEMYGLKSLIEN